ncbi:hypothetical protein LSH36_178g04034 [Paralvinella palmiformis]|uniref:Uncharacterized protein n=1 Tax=Paralvinella palmiformis TaxID=53620 RepID=A0AAD9N8I4_9ANNE|nr:hypothetical protein LSH36_178g04034 [Paralvinella palmiformis]
MCLSRSVKYIDSGAINFKRYDNTEVLGDRITISWFKDLRRARFNANVNRNRRSNWSPDRYDKYKGKYYSGSRYVIFQTCVSSFGYLIGLGSVGPVRPADYHLVFPVFSHG